MADDSDKIKSNVASLADHKMRRHEHESNELKAKRIAEGQANYFVDTGLQLIRTEQVPTYDVFAGKEKHEVTLTFNRTLTVDELQILHKIVEYFTQVKS